MTATKRKYYAPSVTVDASVSLDEFDNADIVEYLRQQGVATNDFGGGAADPMSNGLLITVDDLDRISTLALCGQRDSAREFALGLISHAVGRPL